MRSRAPEHPADQEKTMAHIVIIGFALLSVAFAAPAQAESLEQAWARALESDRSLVAVRLETEAARLEAAAARGLRYPALRTSGSFLQFADAPAFDFSAARSEERRVGRECAG